jgi:hypothetical protein
MEHIARMGVKRIAYRLLVRKPEGKSQPGRPRRGRGSKGIARLFLNSELEGCE